MAGAKERSQPTLSSIVCVLRTRRALFASLMPILMSLNCSHPGKLYFRKHSVIRILREKQCCFLDCFNKATPPPNITGTRSSLLPITLVGVNFSERRTLVVVKIVTFVASCRFFLYRQKVWCAKDKIYVTEVALNKRRRLYYCVRRKYVPSSHLFF